MATYHVSLKTYSRGFGTDPMRHLAYVSGEVIYDERTGLTHISGNRNRVVYSAFLVPNNAPEWVGRLTHDTNTFWNARNLAEDRLNLNHKDKAAIYFEYVVALPIELTLEQNIDLIEDLVGRTFQKEELIIEYFVHWENSNPHVHIVVVDRSPTLDGWSTVKHRRYNRRVGMKEFRAIAALTINHHYALNGSNERVTHLSHTDRGLALEATQHEGSPHSKARIRPDTIAAENRRIKERNAERVQADLGIIIQEVSSLKNVFTEKDLAKTLLTRLNENYELFETLFIDLLDHPDLIPLSLGGAETVYTTVSHQKEEAALLKAGQVLTGCRAHTVNAELTQYIIEQGHRGAGGEALTYSDEQQKVIRTLTEGSNLMQLHGCAGSGKTTALKAVTSAFEGSGFRVVGMAPSGIAALNLEQGTGIHALTIHRWIMDWSLYDQHHRTLATSIPDDATYASMMNDFRYLKPQQLTDKDIVIVDESGMVGTRQLRTILERAARAGAKVILVGDIEQLSAVEYGAPYRALKERIDSRHQCRLDTVYRQRVPWMREACQLMHTNLADGLHAYKERGCITEYATNDDAMNALVHSYLQSRGAFPDKSHVMIAATRAAVAELNQRTRRELIERDGLGGIVPETIVAFGRDLRVDERVILTQNARHMHVQEGQTVGSHRELGHIKNGDLGTVRAIHVLDAGRVMCEVTLDRGGIALIDSALYRDIDYGHAITVHKSQGSSINHTFVLINKGFRSLLAYVAGTRHRDSMTAAYSCEEFKDYAALERHLSQPSYATMAVDYSLNDGEQKVADLLIQYQEAVKVMVRYQRDVRRTVSKEDEVGRYLFRDATYRSLKQDRKRLAKELIEDWSETHNKLCSHLKINIKKINHDAGERTAYEHERERKVGYYCEQLHALRLETERIRADMGSKPYRSNETEVIRLEELQIERDHTAGLLMSYSELKSVIIKKGFNWNQLERCAARSAYRSERLQYYAELSKEKRIALLDVIQFAKEARVLALQETAMKKTHFDISRHMGYDLYKERQNVLNAKAETFVNHIENYKRMLMMEGVEDSELHTRAVCHRIECLLRSGAEIEFMRDSIKYELELDPLLESDELRHSLGLVLPEWIDASYQNSKESSSQAKESSAKETGHAASSNTVKCSISQRSKAFRDAWDRCDAVHLTQTMSGRVNAQKMCDARKARDILAADLVSTVSERTDTPFTEKQWSAIKRFAIEGRRLDKPQEIQRSTPKNEPLETVVQQLKERMPEVCDALISERPRQIRGQEWRYGRNGSLKVMVDGAKQGSFVNFETGEKGGVLQFIATQKQCDLSTAISWARQFVEDAGNHSKIDIERADKTISISKIESKTSINAEPDALTRWISLVPLQDTPQPRKDSPELCNVYKRNHETARYTYTNSEGHPLFYVVRFEPKVKSLDGAAKMTLPLSYGMDVGDELSPKWRYKKYRPENSYKIPLYNLKELKTGLDMPVLIVEGEKTAEAAQRLFPEMVVMTWHGGAGAVHQSDWAVLKDRTVVVWADHDAAGIRAAKTVKDVCTRVGARHVTCINLEFEGGFLPPKWDLADALPAGVTLDDIREKITDALDSFNSQLKIEDAILVLDTSVKSSPTVAKTVAQKGKDLGFEFDMD